MLFNELRLHGKLAAKRHPMYEKNKIGKYIMYASFIFWGAYFIFMASVWQKPSAQKFPIWKPIIF
jgi:hypothetical protein